MVGLGKSDVVLFVGLKGGWKEVKRLLLHP